LSALALPLIPLGLYGLFFVLQGVLFRIETTILRWSRPIPTWQFALPGPLQSLWAWGKSLLPLPQALSWLAPSLDVALLCGLTIWLMPVWFDWLLQRSYQLRPLATATLNQFSPETYQRLQHWARQQQVPLPKLGLITHPAPFALSYGHSAKTARIVVSQGLLDYLADDEIAAIYAAEMGHITSWSMVILSWIVAIAHIPYLIYRYTAQLGDRLLVQASRPHHRFLGVLGKLAAYGLALVSNLSYGLFWILRWAGLTVSRQRLIYGDHSACNLTGNPNGLARALLKLVWGTHHAIQQRQQTDYLLEGLELLMPVGYRQALTLGSLLDRMPPKTALAWDYLNPHRRALQLNNSHALVGERLVRLARYATTWDLSPQFNLVSPSPASPGRTLEARLEAAPFLGAGLGYGAALLCWAVAWLSYWLQMPYMAWLGSDFKLFWGFPLIGFGVGTILRFNCFFPDIPQSWFRGRGEPLANLADEVSDPAALPITARPTVLSGTLLGRPGLANWLGQDLLLHTQQGLVRLHDCSAFGMGGNWLYHSHRTIALLGEPVSAIGWLRRGATAWFDLEQVRSTSGRTSRGAHQLWSTLVATVLVAIGIILIL
jgi:Zn-dependent protease with chaperone function